MALTTSSPDDSSPLQEKNVFNQSETAEREQMVLPWQLLSTFGVIGFFVSFSLNIYLWNQNYTLRSRQQQFAQKALVFQQNEEFAKFFIQDIIYFSKQYPDVKAILAKHGIPVVDNKSSLSVVSPPIPTPIQKPQQVQQSNSKKKT